MAPLRNRKVVLKKHPVGLPKPREDFELVEEMIDTDDCALIIKNLVLSFEASHRVWLTGQFTYIPGIQIGGTVFAVGIGEVVKVDKSQFPKGMKFLMAGGDADVGDLIQGMIHWQEYVVVTKADAAKGMKSEFGPYENYSKRLMPVIATLGFEGERMQGQLRQNPNWFLSLFGVTTMTAYFGFFDVGLQSLRGPKGETLAPDEGARSELGQKQILVVSAAAGATGSMVCQFALRTGAWHVIALAGGEEKCAWLRDEIGVDVALDYKEIMGRKLAPGKTPVAGNLALTKAVRDTVVQLRGGAASGKKVSSLIDMYFDNVGGEILDSMLLCMRNFGAVVACGTISTYNSEGSPYALGNYGLITTRRITYRGFVVTDYIRRYGEAAAFLLGEMERDRNESPDPSGSSPSVKKLQVAESLHRGGVEMAPEVLVGLYTGANTGKLLLSIADATAGNSVRPGSKL